MTDLRGLDNVDQVSEARLWKALDSITQGLSEVKDQLSEVVRLEERVNNHEQALARYGSRLDDHGRRIRENELWQANHGDKDSVERMMANIQTEVQELEHSMKGLEKQLAERDTVTARKEGQWDTTKKILAWVVGILTAALVAAITQG